MLKMEKKKSNGELKALVFNIKRGSFEDGPGIRTNVFLKGCPLRCKWCCNPEGQEYYPELKDASSTKEFFERYMTVDEIMDLFEKDEEFYRVSGGGVTIAGGEPTSHYEFVRELLRRCRENNYHTALDTCGWAEDKSAGLLFKADLLLFDLKILDDEKHIRFTGRSNKPILENFERATQAGKKVIVRTPIIPGYTDSPENIRGIGELLSERENVEYIDIIPFHRYAETKYAVLEKTCIFDEIPLTTPEKIQEIKAVIESYGVKVNVV